MSTIQPDIMLPPLGTQIAQDDIEQQAAVGRISLPSSHDSFTDDRNKSRHLNEDPHYIADYLAHNTSKAAAVFRRYDKLAMYRLLLLSRELDSLEKKHNAFVNSGDPEDAENLKAKGFDNKVGLVLKEYSESYIWTHPRKEQLKQSIDLLPPQITTDGDLGGDTG
ncbi:uncharacterized protein J4E79_001898 [Alternaria viburni]|uniref:uncharacterized protein n=1 Tax=Alternaria viburni TaxID=566460 RepID=UPI0020C3ECD3|nr:uncharacterized protein J4E79_001898 [Alternaria viburni]KAI4667213.1 hypothetical protein J4E79_001898 [Alternaria viburni]